MKEILKELGLTANEVDLYILLLKKGSITIMNVAKFSGMHRQVVYDAINRLIDRGFVSSVKQKNQKFFTAIHPEKLISFMKEKEMKVRSILPALLNLASTPKEDTSVEVFRGKDIHRLIFHDILETFKKEPGEVLTLGGKGYTKTKKPQTYILKPYLKELYRLKCKERILLEEGDENLEEGLEEIYRWLPKKLFTHSPIKIYKNKVAFFVDGDPATAIIIKSKQIATAMRTYFNHFWEIAKSIE